MRLLALQLSLVAHEKLGHEYDGVGAMCLPSHFAALRVVFPSRARYVAEASPCGHSTHIPGNRHHVCGHTDEQRLKSAKLQRLHAHHAILSAAALGHALQALSRMDANERASLPPPLPMPRVDTFPRSIAHVLAPIPPPLRISYLELSELFRQCARPESEGGVRGCVCASIDDNGEEAMTAGELCEWNSMRLSEKNQSNTGGGEAGTLWVTTYDPSRCCMLKHESATIDPIRKAGARMNTSRGSKKHAGALTDLCPASKRQSVHVKLGADNAALCTWRGSRPTEGVYHPKGEEADRAKACSICDAFLERKRREFTAEAATSSAASSVPPPTAPALSAEQQARIGANKAAALAKRRSSGGSSGSFSGR